MLVLNFKKFLMYFLLILLLILIVFIVYTYIVKKPSNNLNWEFGFKKTADVTINNSIVTIKNVRDFKYNSNGPVSSNYIDLTFNVNDIVSTNYLLEPFSKFNAVAHSFLQFNFNDGQKILVSVEARRTVGEKFNAFNGLFNNYELIYVWGTSSDLIGRRILVEKATVYSFPLNMPKEYSKNLFLQMAQESIELKNKPQFYNTLTSNCTNRLAMAANKIKPNVVPFDISWVLPGYSDKFLNKIGFIDLSKGKNFYIVKSF